MKIDIYSHIMPKKYTELYTKKNAAIKQRIEYRSIAVVDIEVRMHLMNRYPDVLQVLTVANIPLETFAEPADAPNWPKSPTRNSLSLSTTTRTSSSPVWPPSP